MRHATRFFTSLAGNAALLAALLVPLYFVVFTERVFEAERAALVRTLGAVALGMALAWLWLDRPRRAAWLAIARQPLALWIAVLLAVEALATLASVAPWRSLLGSYTRGQGLATTVALAALAGGAALVARRPGGTWRLTKMIGAAVFPASMYCLLQRWGLDPLPWLGDNVVRVSGPAGNSVLLGAWLAMALPFVAAATWQAWRQAGAAPSRATSLCLAAWLITAVTGLAAFVLTGSRGPLLGLVAAGLVVGLAAAARQGRRRAAASFLAIAGGLTIVVWALNVAGGPAPPLSALPMVERLATVLDPESSTIRVRRQLWAGSVQAVGGRPERLLLGNGPETMELVWAPYFPPILAYEEPRGQVPDRAHNLAWDTLLTTGGLGLLVLWTFLALLLDSALTALGLLSERVARRRLWLAVVGGSLIGGLLSAAAVGGSFTGPGAGLGALVGLIAWLSWRTLANVPAPPIPRFTPFYLATLAAVTAHFAETQVGFPTVATRLMLWLLAGALIGLATRSDGLAGARSEQGLNGADGAPEALFAAPSAPSARAEDRVAILDPRDGIFAALAVGLALVFEFARPGLVGSGGLGAAALVVLAGIVVGLAVGRPGSWDRRAAGAVVALWAGFAGVQWFLLAVSSRYAADSVPAAAALLVGLGLALGALLVAWAEVAAGGRLRGRGLAGVAGHVIVVGALAGWLLVVPAVADAAYKEGLRGWQPLAQPARAAGEWGKALSFLDRARSRYALAARLAPWEPTYRLALGREAVERGDLLDEAVVRDLAESEPSLEAGEYRASGVPQGLVGRVADRDAAFAAGLLALERAAALAPGAPEPAISRALALRVWADRTRDAAVRQRRLAESRAAWGHALALAPRWPEVYDEAAVTALRAGDAEEALALAQRALAVDGFFRRAWRTSAEAHIARAAKGRDGAASVGLDEELAVGDKPVEGALRRASLAAAAHAYREYFVDYRNASDLATQRDRLAVLLRLGRDHEALQVARDVAQLAPDDPFALADLAVLLDRGGDHAAALEAARRAVMLAPRDLGIADLAGRLEAAGE